MKISRMCFHRVLASVLASACLLACSQKVIAEETSDKTAAIQKFCERFRQEFQPSIIRHFELEPETLRHKEVPPVVTQFRGENIACQSAGAVVVRNQDYIFRLRRETENDDWKINEAYLRETGPADPDQCGPVETQVALAELDRYAPLNINHILLDELLLLPGSKTSGWNTSDDGTVTCVVNLSGAAHHTSNGLRTMFTEVLLKFQPNRYGWIPIRYESEYQNGGRLISDNEDFRTVFGFPVPTKSVVVNLRPDGSTMHTSAWEKVYEGKGTAVPKDVFYLSHYRLPEPFTLSNE